MHCDRLETVCRTTRVVPTTGRQQRRDQPLVAKNEDEKEDEEDEEEDIDNAIAKRTRTKNPLAAVEEDTFFDQLVRDVVLELSRSLRSNTKKRYHLGPLNYENQIRTPQPLLHVFC